MALENENENKKEAIVDAPSSAASDIVAPENDTEDKDYAKLEKRAHRALVYSAIICVGLLAVLGITAISWGVAAYAIGFAATAVAGAGAITIGSSWFARRHYRKYRKMQEASAKAQSGKTKRGRVLSPEKQAAASHQASKNAEYLAEKGKISDRVKRKYSVSDKDAEAQARAGRRGHKLTSEEMSIALRTNRAQIKFRADQSRESFINNDLSKYSINPDKTGTVELMAQKYSDARGYEYNTDGKPVYETIAKYECASDVDLLATQKCVINSLALGNSEYPICLRVTAGGVSKPVFFMNQENVNSYKSEFDARTDKYLAGCLLPPEKGRSEPEKNVELEASPTMTHTI